MHRIRSHGSHKTLFYRTLQLPPQRPRAAVFRRAACGGQGPGQPSSSRGDRRHHRRRVDRSLPRPHDHHAAIGIQLHGSLGNLDRLLHRMALRCLPLFGLCDGLPAIGRRPPDRCGIRGHLASQGIVGFKGIVVGRLAICQPCLQMDLAKGCASAEQGSVSTARCKSSMEDCQRCSNSAPSQPLKALVDGRSELQWGAWSPTNMR